MFEEKNSSFLKSKWREKACFKQKINEMGTFNITWRHQTEEQKT